jgi:2-amino-4-hydroxy-6-hydroxymethyldihydropteridine diphosphokinase
VTAVIALGSNLGHREATIRSAVRDLAATPGVTVLRTSSLVETPALKPQGVDEDAPAYLNAAVTIRTSLGPRELLDRLHTIEQAHGRERLEHWGNRTLDLDIVSMDGARVDEPDLVIPHPRAHERAFVLAPWLEIEPDAMLGGVRVDRLLAALPDAAPVRVETEPLL